MKKTNIYAAMIAITMVLSLASCAESAVSSDNTAETTTKTTADLSTEKVSGEKVAAGDTENADTEIKSAFTDDGDSLDIVSASFEGSTSGMLDTADMFSERDLEQTADLSEAEYITVSSNDTISITDGGVYVISGSAENCTIRVEADSQEKVQLVLDGVSITNEDFPAIYVVSADKCFITTAEGSENTLSVTGSFTADADTNTDAVIFSKDDIVFNGMGVLNISSAYGNGISGKDDIKFTGGTYNIQSEKDSLTIMHEQTARVTTIVVASWWQHYSYH